LHLKLNQIIHIKRNVALLDQSTENAVFDLSCLFASATTHTDNAWLNDLADFFKDLFECAFSVYLGKLSVLLEEWQEFS
jgi:hypothetical protein